jgi:pimeloyl-ACP methyl ester carboxylesterase
METYLTFGKGSDLILGHGMAQNKELWIKNGWVEELSKIRRVHLFDFSGHGEKANLNNKKFSVTDMAQNINEISNDLDCKKFDYIGFSMGARAGFEAASKNIKLDKLISLGMHPGSPKLEEKRFIKRSNAMKNLGKKTGDSKYLIYSKIFEKALHWQGAIDSIKWEKNKHFIIMGEKDDNYNLTKSLLKDIGVEILHTLKEINHKNTFDEPKHSLNAIINFLQDRR